MAAETFLRRRLAFDNADKGQADKQCIVRWPACGGPFGNGEIAPFRWTHTGSVSHLLGIGLPSAVSELLIDQGACGSLIEIDFRRGFFATLDEVNSPTWERAQPLFGQLGGERPHDRPPRQIVNPRGDMRWPKVERARAD